MPISTFLSAAGEQVFHEILIDIERDRFFGGT